MFLPGNGAMEVFKRSIAQLAAPICQSCNIEICAGPAWPSWSPKCRGWATRLGAAYAFF
jgi:hypothetical protein